MKGQLDVRQGSSATHRSLWGEVDSTQCELVCCECEGGARVVSIPLESSLCFKWLAAASAGVPGGKFAFWILPATSSSSSSSSSAEANILRFHAKTNEECSRWIAAISLAAKQGPGGVSAAAARRATAAAAAANRTPAVPRIQRTTAVPRSVQRVSDRAPRLAAVAAPRAASASVPAPATTARLREAAALDAATARRVQGLPEREDDAIDRWAVETWGTSDVDRKRTRWAMRSHDLARLHRILERGALLTFYLYHTINDEIEERRSIGTLGLITLAQLRSIAGAVVQRARKLRRQARAVLFPQTATPVPTRWERNAWWSAFCADRAHVVKVVAPNGGPLRDVANNAFDVRVLLGPNHADAASSAAVKLVRIKTGLVSYLIELLAHAESSSSSSSPNSSYRPTQRQVRDVLSALSSAGATVQDGVAEDDRADFIVDFVFRVFKLCADASVSSEGEVLPRRDGGESGDVVFDAYHSNLTALHDATLVVNPPRVALEEEEEEVVRDATVEQEKENAHTQQEKRRVAAARLAAKAAPLELRSSGVLEEVSSRMARDAAASAEAVDRAVVVVAAAAATSRSADDAFTTAREMLARLGTTRRTVESCLTDATSSWRYNASRGHSWHDVAAAVDTDADAAVAPDDAVAAASQPAPLPPAPAPPTQSSSSSSSSAYRHAQRSSRHEPKPAPGPEEGIAPTPASASAPLPLAERPRGSDEVERARAALAELGRWDARRREAVRREMIAEHKRSTMARGHAAQTRVRINPDTGAPFDVSSGADLAAASHSLDEVEKWKAQIKMSEQCMSVSVAQVGQIGIVERHNREALLSALEHHSAAALVGV